MITRAETASDVRPSPAGGAREVYVVAGMHRAGTSVVARALQALGVDLGDRLMSADVRMNARGFFEDLDVVALDDAELALCGADWKSVDPLVNIDDALPQRERFVDAASRVLDARFGRSTRYGFKDPRVPRLLPLWQRAFAAVQAADYYVIAVRHPLSVLASLTARDALDERRSGWLWVVHMLCALKYTAGRPRVVVDYDRLLAYPQQELERIARLPGLSGQPLPAAARGEFEENFLSVDLRHAVHEPGVSGAAGRIPLLADVHDLAQGLASDTMPVDSPGVLARVDDLFDRMNAFSPLLSYVGSVERVADQFPRIEGELAWARASLSEASAFAADLRENLEIATQGVVVAQNYNGALLATLTRKDGELAAAYAGIEQLREAVKSAQAWSAPHAIRRILKLK